MGCGLDPSSMSDRTRRRLVELYARRWQSTLALCNQTSEVWLIPLLILVSLGEIEGSSCLHASSIESSISAITCDPRRFPISKGQPESVSDG